MTNGGWIMNPDTILHLKRILQRESRSLLQYLRESWPWAAISEQATAERLRRMIGEEQAAGRGVADFLSRRRVSFDLGQFSEEFTATNYLALDHLLPRLVSHQKWAIAELQNDLAKLTDPEARRSVEPILEMKRRHLEQLEQLAAEHSGAKAVSTLR